MTALAPFLNQLIHGDCLPVMASLPADSVHLIVTDPPYGVNYTPRDGRTIVGDDATDWMQPAFAEMYRVLRPDSLCVSFYGWPQVDVFLSSARAAGFRPVSHFVFLKDYGSRWGYTSGCHEAAFLLAKGRPKRPAAPPRDVLSREYSENRYHPTQKPVMALCPLIAAYSAVGEIVLDPFAGSASTAIAARQLARSYIAIEQDAHYYRQACERLHGAE